MSREAQRRSELSGLITELDRQDRFVLAAAVRASLAEVGMPAGEGARIADELDWPNSPSISWTNEQLNELRQAMDYSRVVNYAWARRDECSTRS